MFARRCLLMSGLGLSFGMPVSRHALAVASAHGITFTSIDGAAMPLSAFAGQVVLVVNTASRCGFTYQYDNLQALWAEYQDRGLTVIGVPTNDFGNQEPGTEAEIKEFCEVNFSVTFPMTEKVTTRGPNAHPFFGFVADNLGEQALPRWNFHKYLIDPDGRLVASWGSTTEPTSSAIRTEIDRLLIS